MHVLRRIRAVLAETLWAVPTSIVAGVTVLAFAILAVDRRVETSSALTFGGGGDGARAILGAIASSMVTLTGLVFSITVVVLQLASSQYSPRILHTFLRDGISKVALGLFVGTFAYALVVLRDVRTDPDGDRVPGLAVTGAVLLVAASLALFVAYIHHISQSIRIEVLLRRIADDARVAIRCGQLPAGDGGGSGDMGVLVSGSRSTIDQEGPGETLLSVDAAALVRIATAADAVVAVVPAVGDFVVGGAPLAHVWTSDGAVDPALATDIRGTLAVGAHRTARADLVFGFRQLADVAARALSPGVNDPATAVQALDHVHDLLRELAARPDPASWHLDATGRPRVFVGAPTWTELALVGTVEARRCGAGSIAVARRLRSLWLDLEEVVTPGRRAFVDAQREALDRAVDAAMADPDDRRLASMADRQGLGSTRAAP